jgi:hypothetical protein
MIVGWSRTADSILSESNSSTAEIICRAIGSISESSFSTGSEWSSGIGWECWPLEGTFWFVDLARSTARDVINAFSPYTTYQILQQVFNLR